MKKYVLFTLVVLVLANLSVSFGYGQDRVDVQMSPSTANIWYFHSPSKGLNFYLMSTWPDGGLLTKFGPPKIQLGKSAGISIGVGPDLFLKAKTAKELFKSFTLDVVPSMFFGKFSAVLVNEVGVNKDGSGIYFIRHSIGFDPIGVRYSSAGAFGKKAFFFRIGPTVKFGKIQLWIPYDTVGKEWLVEVSLSIPF